MPALVIQTSTVHINSNNLSIPAYLAHPTKAEGAPIIIVIQEIFGVNEHIREVTERIAKEGYIALAPHIYHRQAPGFEVGYGEADLELGRKYKNGTKADELIQDIQGAIAYGKTHFDNVPEKVGCIGFCFGGHVAYLAATLPVVSATASFYGAGICTFTPGGDKPTLSQTPEIQGWVYAFFGLQDPLIPLAEVDEIEATLQQHNINHRVFRYPNVGHGFFCDRRGSYDAASAEDAWNHTKTLFQTQLKQN